MNRKIFLDNASTTPLRKEVYISLLKTLKRFGNPSSNHSLGVYNKYNIEYSRIKIAKLLNISAEEIIFTSSGTEANNFILRNCVKHLKVQCIITSLLEHKSVLETVYDLYLQYDIIVKFVTFNSKGEIDLNHLRKLLKENTKITLVSLMYVNNEIGNILNLKKVSEICREFNTYLHSDTIQAIGHLNLNLNKLNLHFASASAHKFYGPYGIGFAYIKKKISIKSFLTGGLQEKNRRAGTENIYGIIGMTEALQLAYNNLNSEKNYIKNIKKYCIKKLQHNIPNLIFNGLSKNINKSIYTILSIAFPKKYLLSLNLDLKGVIISQSSACISSEYSHVFKSLYKNTKIYIQDLTFLRISFGIFNKKKEIKNFLKLFLSFF
ncbi:cysteine desulfurase family protein [Candidatus Karelsulcia muelleri]|uniref:cysteine desulfurase family protein n=1 Tax=Candidatus Karelsulcia muelleri TaxID=336810 RepID=UPI00194E497D|nr:cysteine desulfurase family protein [Candidatus Karelsulcia muelleri]